ncbi:MAG: 50S ribosomal protein L22 [Candidatus Omnitrophota bacterium]
MISKAIARYLRISPRKTRKVIDLVRGLPVLKAEAILNTVEKRPAFYIRRVMRAAMDSADKLSHVSAPSLYISLIKADEGPMLKRYRAASMGRAGSIKHRTTHLTIELDKIKTQEKKVVVEEKIVKKSAAKKLTKEVKRGTKNTSV